MGDRGPPQRILETLEAMGGLQVSHKEIGHMYYSMVMMEMSSPPSLKTRNGKKMGGLARR